MRFRDPRAGWARVGCTLIVGATAALDLGCEAPTGSPAGNLPPATFLSISDADVDTTFYAFDLSWWGADADGDVDRYQFRWDRAFTPDSTDTLVDGWIETRLTSRRFVVEVMGTEASPTFSVRAIDDDGAPDPTPETQTFHVRNIRPTASFSDSIPRPTRSLPAVTFSVSADDSNGVETLRGFYTWFEGADFESTRRFFPGVGYTEFTLGPDMFPTSGILTMNVVSVDETNTTSVDTLRHTWEVVDVTGRSVLLVDHHPDEALGGPEIDAFFLDNLAAVVDEEDILTLSYGRDGGFRTAEEIDLLLDRFDGVVWYGGQAINAIDSRQRADELGVAAPALESFVRSGGSFFLQSTYAFADLRAISEGGSVRDWDAAWDSLATHQFLGRAAFETNPLGNSNFALLFDTVHGESAAGVEVMATGAMNNVDFFGPVPGGESVAWVPPGTVDIGYDSDGNLVSNTVDFTCGISVPIGAGRFVGLTFPLARGGGPGDAGAVARHLFGTLF